MSINCHRICLEGDGLRLRTFITEDVTDEFVSWLNDPIVVKYSNQRFIKHTRETCLHYLNSFHESDNLYLAVETLNESRLVGSITAYCSIVHSTADIGIMIGDYHVWGKGVGRRAWGLLMTYLFEQCAIRKVTGGTLRPNTGMIRVMEKTGMKLEAIRIEQEICNGSPVDMLHYSKFHND